MRENWIAVSMTQLRTGAQKTASPARSHARDRAPVWRDARAIHPLVTTRHIYNRGPQLLSQDDPSLGHA